MELDGLEKSPLTIFTFLSLLRELLYMVSVEKTYLLLRAILVISFLSFEQ